MGFNLLSVIPRIIYHVGRIFYDYHQVRKARANGDRLDSTRFTSGTSFGKILQYRLLATIKSVGRALANVIRSPYYAVGMMAGCVYTWFAPKNGNKLISRFENDWNHGTSCAEWLKSPNPSCFYQAPCMQILSDLKEDDKYAEYRIRDESADTWGRWMRLSSPVADEVDADAA